jgi:hypothetical protein
MGLRVAKKIKNESVRLDPMERIARVLAMIATRELEKEDAARRLLSVGFDSPQIGGILGVGPNFANVAKSRSPKAKG